PCSPPASTPFPYTPLFRSLVRQRVGQGAHDHLAQRLVEHAAVAHADRLADQRDRHGRLDLLGEVDLLEVDVQHVAADGVELPVLDRKSTRLNSSHVNISYA